MISIIVIIAGFRSVADSTVTWQAPSDFINFIQLCLTQDSFVFFLLWSSVVPASAEARPWAGKTVRYRFDAVVSTDYGYRATRPPGEEGCGGILNEARLSTSDMDMPNYRLYLSHF